MVVTVASTYLSSAINLWCYLTMVVFLKLYGLWFLTYFVEYKHAEIQLLK